MHFIFNRIYVVQSLPDGETQTGLELFENIIQRRCYQADTVDAKFVDISSSIDFYGFFKSLLAECIVGFLPYLHFEIHGNEHGLVLKNGDFIQWQELRPLLSKVNCQSKNNLFVSLATCYGGFIYRAIDALDRGPFCGYVGPASELIVKDLVVDWENYFDALLTTSDFQVAVDNLNATNPNKPYVIFSSKQIFDITKKYWLKGLSTRKAKRERLASMTKTAKKFPVVQQYTRAQQTEIFKRYLNSQPEIWQRIENYFMVRTDRKPFDGLRR